jgi:Ubiquitin-activating enzyme E1 four-helix bundle
MYVCCHHATAQGFRALHAFRATHGALPEPGNTAHAAEVLNLAYQLNKSGGGGAGGGGGGGGFVSEQLEGGDDAVGKAAMRVLGALASSSRGVTAPVCAALGGVVGQEVLKAASGKFMPIRQWLYWDAEEALPPSPAGVPLREEVAPHVRAAL